MRDENMSYTVKSSERLRKSGSEAETKALLQQHKILKSKKTPVSYLSAESDRLAFGKKIESLERVQNKIAELRKARNSVSTRKSKWEHIDFVTQWLRL